MTIAAAAALKQCDVIVGYTVYADLIRDHFPDKEYVTTPMRQEVKRCQIAFEYARSGRTVAMICSGDAGVYGMAGLMYEVGEAYPEVTLKVLPGVTALTGGAAVLGAPLMHDMAVISLSDLLTPWEKIEKRLIMAARADFVICLYNPSSRKRADYLRRACEQIAPYVEAKRVCGTVRNIARDGEAAEICTFEQLCEKQTDMFTTVYIGNSDTRVIGNKMVTPRGYVTGEERNV